MNTPIQAAVYVALLIAAFFLGNLTAKVQYLEQAKAGSGPAVAGAQAAKGKYATFEDAITAMAKSAGADAKKIVSCMNGGGKKDIVEKDYNYGETVGVSGTPGFFINGRFIGGAYPFEAFKEVIDKELAGTATDNPADYSELLQNANKSGSFDPKPKQVDLANAPVQGDTSAQVTIVEFSDFQCPFCEKAFPVMEQVLKEYKGKVKLAYRYFPLDFHPRAQKTAEAAECAKDQGKFWEFHDQLFAQQADWTNL